MFNDLLTIVEENGKGIFAFQKCAEAARVRAADSAEQAAAWVLLAAITEEFVERYERMPITSDLTEQLNGLLAAEIERLDKAYSGADPAQQLAAINQTAWMLIKQGGDS